MYKIEEAKKIYDAFRNDKLGDEYPDLLPYKGYMKRIDWDFLTFHGSWGMSDEDSSKFWAGIFNILKRMNPKDIPLLSDPLISFYHRYKKVDLFLYYLETIISPNEVDNFYHYITSFDLIFEYGIDRVYCYPMYLPKYNNMRKILVGIYKHLKTNNRTLCILVSACLYRNHNKYTDDVIDEFYDNFDKYISHIMLNFDNLKSRTTFSYCNSIVSQRKYNVEKLNQLEYIYNSIENVLDSILMKMNGEEEKKLCIR